MPPARVLVLEETKDGVTVDGFDENGTFSGDTWHPNLEDAKLHVEDKDGSRVTQWHVVPRKLKCQGHLDIHAKTGGG
jgi:hypothetical protein